MKKVLAVVLVVAMVLSLTACGGGVSVGKYKLTGMKMSNGGDEVDYLEIAKQLGGISDTEDLGYLEIIDDKNAIMKSPETDEQKLTYDDKYFYAVGGTDDQKIEYKASGSKVTFTYTEDPYTIKIEFTKE